MLVRRPLQFRQALGDVDVQVLLDVDVELLRGFQSGRSLARQHQPGLDQLHLGGDAGRRGRDVDLAGMSIQDAGTLLGLDKL